MVRLYDKKIIDGAHCQVNEICDEPNNGLIVVTLVRPGQDEGKPWLFTIPVVWWERMRADAD